MSLVRLRSICSGRAKRASALDAILKSGFDGSNKHTTAEADRVIDHADQRADESDAKADGRHLESNPSVWLGSQQTPDRKMSESIYKFVEQPQRKQPKKQIYRSKYDPNSPLSE